MRLCPGCKVEKPYSEYGKKAGSKLGIQSRCKFCRNAHQKVWYSENSEEHKERVNKVRNSRKSNYFDLLVAYLLDHPCVDCGCSDPMALDFDHVEGDKTFNIGTGSERTWQQVLDEIDKCVVRCRNCHQRRTAIAGNWGRWQAVQRINNRDVAQSG